MASPVVGERSRANSGTDEDYFDNNEANVLKELQNLHK